MTATMGELGEAANILKKLNRVRDGIPGNTMTPEHLRSELADELADVAIYSLISSASYRGSISKQSGEADLPKQARKSDIWSPPRDHHRSHGHDA